ncbi:Uncharacterised protein [BD1-7 clade bacterium]|uniref:VWFA domain-containing protein n=1 Tax=BD1-7 clade bacterium TaxID=2029982 RepID=A0A5S9PSM6_9GAMM|nr:Uncharacterised protein [BD1-7 clade bacterium]
MSFSELIANFHFIRPELLALLPLGLAFVWFARHSIAAASNWNKVIDPALLPFLIDGENQVKSQRWPVAALVLAWCLACFAIAGPVWEKIEQPVVKKQNALVIILDLTLSMYAEDQKPSRLVAAKRKVEDILKQRKEGVTALVVFSGDAHTVAPLTDDVRTIDNMLPALEPSVMPKFGNNVGSAIKQANELIEAATVHQAQYLLLADELNSNQFKTVANLLPAGVQLDIISFGTPSGAPIPLPEGFLKNRAGATVIAKTDTSQIMSDSRKYGFGFAKSSVTDTDINRLLSSTHQNDDEKETVDRQFDLWQEMGHWLVLLILPIALFSFRRGWILLALVIVMPQDAWSLTWDDLWKTQDQQAAAKLESGNTSEAAGQFNDQRWQSAAHYQSGDYQKALDSIDQLDIEDQDSQDYYNRGNALARMNQFDDAIAAYDKALEINPNDEDAAFNKQLIEQLKQQQENQENQSGENGEDSQQQDGESGEQQDQQSNGADDSNQEGQQGESGESSSDQQDGQNSESSSDQNNDGQDMDDSQQQDASQGSENSENADQNKEQSEEQQAGENANSQDQTDESEQPDDATEAQQADEETDEQDQTDAEQQAIAQGQQEPMSAEEKAHQQALQQWLRRIPDDSGMLLRNKFRHQYEQNRRNNEHIDKDSEQLW